MLVALEEYLDARPAAVAGAPASPPAAPADALPGGQTVVTANATRAIPESAIAAGGELDMIVTLFVKEGWHVYANPTGAAFLKPTTVTLPAGQPATLAEVRYPPGTATLATLGSDEKASVYAGEVKLTARVRLDAQAQPGPLTLNLKVAYQACNDRACLAPATLSVPLLITVAH